MYTMSTSGSGSVLMRACQVVGEKGVYKALVDAGDAPAARQGGLLAHHLLGRRLPTTPLHGAAQDTAESCAADRGSA